MDNKQQAFNPGYGQQPPPYSESTGGSAYPPYPQAVGYPQQQGYAPQGGYPQQPGFPQQGGYPPMMIMGGGAYPPGPGYGAAPMGGGFGGQPGFGGGFGGAPPMGMGAPMGFRVPLNPEEAHDEPKPYEDGEHGLGFTEKSIRMAFIRKVYSILCVQLLATTAIIALFVFHEGVKTWVRGTPAFMWACFVIAIVLMFALACCESVRRRSPTNIIVLALFTLTYAVVIATSASRFRADVVVLAVGITAIVCLALTIFSFQTKIDFTKIGGTLFVCSIVLFLFGIVAIFLRHKFPILHLVYAAIGTLVFSVYLIHDTQMMMGGKHKYSISPEEYIFAALNIYTDIIMIFTYILTLLGSND